MTDLKRNWTQFTKLPILEAQNGRLHSDSDRVTGKGEAHTPADGAIVAMELLLVNLHTQTSSSACSFRRKRSWIIYC